MSDFEDRFLLEEGVYWRYTTDEKRNIDHKDIQIVQVITKVSTTEASTINTAGEDSGDHLP